MISVKIFKHEDQYTGFVMDGHAKYGRFGKDIVCAAVSALVLTTVNSVENFTEDSFSGDASPDGGHISMEFEAPNSSDLQLLIKSMILGLSEIEKKYGSKYISLQFEEV